MFLGSHFPRLDDKGRLILPARFRDQLADGLVVTRGQERCLYVFPAAEFAALLERVRRVSVADGRARHYTRVLLSGASDEVPDRQGRITLPPVLRAYAGLSREVAVVGAGARVEVWAGEAWRAYLAEQEEAFSATAEEVVPGLL